MKSRILLVAVLVLVAGVVLAQGYEREDKERPLGGTILLDGNARVTRIFLHSWPIPWTDVEGVKNPIMSVRLLSVTSSRAPSVRARLRDGGYWSPVSSRIVDNETNDQLCKRLAAEAEGDSYGGDQLKKYDLATAEYDFSREVTVNLVLTRYLGYDDEEMYNDDGSLRRWFIQNKKVNFTLPERLYRLHYRPRGQSVDSVTDWTEGDLSDLERLIRRAYRVEPEIEIAAQAIHETIEISCSMGPLWSGKWGEAGEMLKPRTIPTELRYQKRSNACGDYFEGIVGGEFSGNDTTSSRSMNSQGQWQDNAAANNYNNQTTVDATTNIGISNSNAAAAGN